MKLPAIPFITKSVSVEYFLALVFESDKISAMLFSEQEKTLTILSSHEAGIDLESASIEDLVVASDTVISRVEMSLDDNKAALEKTIFAVPHAWVEEGRIKAERLSQLKKISTELALTPMGFIVSIEAIIAYLQKKEGAPISGVFVEVADKVLTVFIVRSGNVIDVKHGPIGESVENTVEKLLSQVTKLDVLPSKIILIHTKESEAVSQRFLSHHWTKELPFMHLPQVAILERGFENEAIISGVATQLNVSVSGTVEMTREPEIDEQQSAQFAGMDTFGFVMDEDIASPNVVAASASSPPDELGFSEDTIKSEPIIKHHSGNDIREDAGEEVFEDDMIYAENDRESRSSSPIGTIKNAIASFLTPSTFSNIPKAIGSGKKILFILVGLVIVGAAIFVYYTFLLRATITIYTAQKAVKEDSLDIQLTTDEDSSFADKTIRISTIEEEVTGEEQQETTGTKATGQKATGTITIFNKSEGSKKIDKGTTITSSNKLDFTLNDEVNIASTSSFSTSFSSATAKVTAANFGKEFNIPSQTNFTLKGFSTSDLFGKNDSAFTGGTKEEIQVVAKKDLQDLESTITKRLFDKAVSQAKSDIDATDGLIPSYISYEFTDKTFDRDQDEKATSVKLDATVVYTLGIYKKEELQKFIASSDEFDVPKDFKLSDTETSVTITDIVQDDESLSAKLSFNAVFKPELEVAKLPQLIAGKSEEEALSILNDTSGISDATIDIPFKLPLLPVVIPLRPENITIELKTQ